ncbi:MAG: hypothetical protein MJ252_16525 [archaeon]|nr:hypothetical protein [archaeon]
MSKTNTAHMYNDMFLRLDPNTMRTYKNMMHAPKSSTKMYSVDTSANAQTSASTRVGTSKSFKAQRDLPYSRQYRPKKPEREKLLKQSYAKFVEMRIQTTYPCARQERRFKWQLINGMPMDPEQHPEIGIKRVHVENEFDGGFQKFFNEEKKDSLPEPSRKLLLNQTFGFTKRVINPEENVNNIK